VVNRKVWGGNRTPTAAAAQGILMTILFTARKNGRDALNFLGSHHPSQAMTAHEPLARPQSQTAREPGAPPFLTNNA
jgi:hypothetical protein